MFKVSARTVLELGAELISSDIIAFYELIKNGFDAKTKSGIEIHFNILIRRNTFLSLLARSELGGIAASTLSRDARLAFSLDAPGEMITVGDSILKGVKSVAQFRDALKKIYDLNHITVSDTGSGMSLEGLSTNYLTIGTASRRRDLDSAIKAGAVAAPFLGEKGIGRLSAMRLGEKLTVTTARVNDSCLNILDIDWSAFADLDAFVEDIKVTPSKGPRKPTSEYAGTIVKVANLSEDWTRERVQKMVEYDFARLTDPFADQKSRPRVIIYWNGERMSIPWMNSQLLQSAHAKVSGSYKMVDGAPQFTCTLSALDLGYEHPPEEQTITIGGPDLESCIAGASQDIPDVALLTVGDFDFEAFWYNRRRLTGIEGIGELKTVRELQQKWSGILLFRDHFRVFPYGEDDDDWLALDRRALGRSGYSLNKTQFIGRAQISRIRNPQLVDQTNREGLRQTPEREVFVGVIQYAINTFLFNFLREMDQQYKSQKIDLTEAKSEITTLQSRATSAIKKLRKVVPKEDADTLEELEQTFFEFREFSEKARKRIEEVEQESRQVIELAGVGMMVEVVAHELARASENALENLERLRKKAVPAEVSAALESLRAQMKSLSKRVKILDPLSVSGRQRFEQVDLVEAIEEILAAHEGQFERHQIKFTLISGNEPINVRAVKGMIVQIIENLISNSKYWMEMRQLREPSYRPEIKIAFHSTPPTIIYSDNGRGISPDNRERIFKPFFSLKEKSKRRGLGLFIAKECADYNGASIYLSEEIDSGTGRLHQFVLEFPAQAQRK